MTETAGAGAEGVARLDELAAVTGEYARYANERAGLAGVVVGAWLVAAFAIGLRSEIWGRVAALWAPFATAVALAVARRLYQRRGVILPTAGRDRRAGPSSWNVALLLAAITASAVKNAESWAGGRDRVAWAALWLAVTVAPFLPLAYERIAGGGQHRAMVYGALMDAFFAALFGGDGDLRGGARVVALLALGGFAVLGLVLAGAGVAEHLKFDRLERRLAALREAA